MRTSMIKTGLEMYQIRQLRMIEFRKTFPSIQLTDCIIGRHQHIHAGIRDLHSLDQLHGARNQLHIDCDFKLVFELSQCEWMYIIRPGQKCESSGQIRSKRLTRSAIKTSISVPIIIKTANAIMIGKRFAKRN